MNSYLKQLIARGALIGGLTGLLVLVLAILCAGIAAVVLDVYASQLVNSHVLVGLSGAVAIATAGGFVYGHRSQAEVNTLVQTAAHLNATLLLRHGLPYIVAQADPGRWSFMVFLLRQDGKPTLSVRRSMHDRHKIDTLELVDSVLRDFERVGAPVGKRPASEAPAFERANVDFGERVAANYEPR